MHSRSSDLLGQRQRALAQLTGQDCGLHAPSRGNEWDHHANFSTTITTIDTSMTRSNPASTGANYGDIVWVTCDQLQGFEQTHLFKLNLWWQRKTFKRITTWDALKSITEGLYRWREDVIGKVDFWMKHSCMVSSKHYPSPKTTIAYEKQQKSQQFSPMPLTLLLPPMVPWNKTGCVRDDRGSCRVFYTYSCLKRSHEVLGVGSPSLGLLLMNRKQI